MEQCVELPFLFRMNFKYIVTSTFLQILLEAGWKQCSVKNVGSIGMVYFLKASPFCRWRKLLQMRVDCNEACRRHWWTTIVHENVVQGTICFNVLDIVVLCRHTSLILEQRCQECKCRLMLIATTHSNYTDRTFLVEFPGWERASTCVWYCNLGSRKRLGQALVRSKLWG